MRAQKEADPKWFEALLEKYQQVLKREEAALDAGDMGTLGRCLDEVTRLPAAIGKELDLVVAARKAEPSAPRCRAPGVAAMLALTPTEESQRKVRRHLRSYPQWFARRRWLENGVRVSLKEDLLPSIASSALL